MSDAGVCLTQEDRDLLNTMPAGPELDALIECRVFGEKQGIGYYGPPLDPSKLWSHIESVRYDTPEQAEAAYLAYWTVKYPTEESRRGRAKPDDLNPTLCYWSDGWGPLSVDDYSTDIAAAWTVVEKLRDHGWHHFDLEQYRPDYDGYQWIACIGGEHHGADDPEIGRKHLCVEAETAPLAICRAALIALQRRNPANMLE